MEKLIRFLIRLFIVLPAILLAFCYLFSIVLPVLVWLITGNDPLFVFDLTETLEDDVYYAIRKG